MIGIRPLLAATLDPLNDPTVLNRIRFPVFCSPKLDGIRAISMGSGQLLSRSGKLIPSKQARALFGGFNKLDGELIYDTPTIPNVYNVTQSFVMSIAKPALGDDGLPLLRYYVFDRITDDPYEVRNKSLPVGDKWLIPLPQTHISSLDTLLVYEEECLKAGYEGIMIRSINGLYKQGRATLNDQILMKLKRFSEFEARIVAFEEQLTNLNTPILDDLGYTERSTSKENLVPADTLGSIIVDYQGTPLSVSCGCMDHAMRKHVWRNQKLFLGKVIVVRHLDKNLIGYLPRFGRFAGFREDGR